ncbi:MAG: RNA polymerase sigma factor [Cyclobacteriaceae bacterium]
MKERNESKQDYEVFEKEILPHYRNLYYYVCKSIKDPDLAKDILQDAYTLAFKYIDSFEPGTNGLAWIHTILKNTIVNNIRKAKSRGKDDLMNYEVAENFGLLSNYSKSGSYYESNVESKGFGDSLIKAFDTLNSKHKTVMILSELYGYNYAEIARILDTPKGTVMSRLHRAKKTLRTKMLESGTNE